MAPLSELHRFLSFWNKRYSMVPIRVTLLTLALAASTGTLADEQAPTRADCEAAVYSARTFTEKLPADDLSRYFAQRHLMQALVEAGNGEYDDCIERAEMAMSEVREQHHVLLPGRKFEVLGGFSLGNSK